MITYFSPTGWFNTALLTPGIIHQPLTLLRNVLAVQISLFIQGFPFTFLSKSGGGCDGSHLHSDNDGDGNSGPHLCQTHPICRSPEKVLIPGRRIVSWS